VVIEIDAAESALDPRLTRRLIALEINEVDVPADPAHRSEGPPTLFFRILAGRGDALDVELWERGILYGRRTLTASQGSSRLRARRIALAAAELARGMRQARRLEAKRLAEAERQRLLERQRLAETPPFARLALEPGVEGLASFGSSSLWLVGPRVTGQVRFRDPIRLELGASWMFGRAALQNHPGVEWLELSTAVAYARPFTKRVGVWLGARAAAASVHLTRLETVDAIRGRSHTWSARALLETGLELKLHRGFGLSVGPAFGIILRPIPVSSASGNREQLSGMWVGGGVGLVVDPSSRK
jgi:hypothetical protein